MEEQRPFREEAYIGAYQSDVKDKSETSNITGRIICEICIPPFPNFPLTT